MSKFIQNLKSPFEYITKPIIKAFSYLNISPNIITISGLVIVIAGSYFILQKSFLTAGLILIIGALFDALDGHLARYINKTTKFGAFLDSNIDRISDAVPLFAIAYIFKDDILYFSLSLLSVLFSFLTSYARARAEGLGLECKVGILERPERVIIIISALITGYLELGIIILFFGSFITFIQRIVYVYKQAK